MINQAPEISIIIPVYNIAPYLEECVESIINQSFTDFEVILVDDGSNDGSTDLCDKYKTYSNFRVIHTKNEGAAHARNTGLDIAKGKYVAFIDGDDVIVENYLEILYKEIETQNVDIAVCCCKSIENGEEDHFFSKDTIVHSRFSVLLRMSPVMTLIPLPGCPLLSEADWGACAKPAVWSVPPHWCSASQKGTTTLPIMKPRSSITPWSGSLLNGLSQSTPASTAANCS